MCGRYGRRGDKQRIAEWMQTHNTDVFNEEYYEENGLRFGPTYNAAPDTLQPVVRLDSETGERVLVLMKWGLVPYWSKTPKVGFSSINARSEALETSGAWREPWKKRRCLIPADFFYEWEPQTDEERKKKATRKPWAVALKGDKPFAFGGIWDRWKGKSEDGADVVFESFSIVTTDPNEVLEPFHNRCPLIVEPKDWERWMAPADPAQLPVDLLRPLDADEMKAWRVNAAVGNVRNNRPDLLDEVNEDGKRAGDTLF